MAENNKQIERDLSEKYAKLWPELAEADRRELAIFEKAVAENLQRFEGDPSVGNNRNLKHSKRGLRELTARLEATYLKKDDRFSDRSEALKWLKAKGYRIGKTKLYADSRKGLLRMQPDRAVLKKDVEQYAKTLANLGDPRDKTLDAHRLKMEAACRRLEKQNALLDFDLQEKKGKYILRNEAEMERAGLIITMEANFRNLLVGKASEFIEIVHGDQDRIAGLQFQFNESMDDMFRKMAKVEKFRVILKDDQ